MADPKFTMLDYEAIDSAESANTVESATSYSRDIKFAALLAIVKKKKSNSTFS